MKTLIVPMMWGPTDQADFPETWQLATNRKNMQRAGEEMDKLARGPVLCTRHDHTEACYDSERHAQTCGFITGMFQPVDENLDEFVMTQLFHRVSREAFEAEQLTLWRRGVLVREKGVTAAR